MITDAESATSSDKPFPGARSALGLLLLINLFNYADRYVLAAVVGPIKRTYFGAGGFAGNDDALAKALNWFQHHVGFKPDDACLGLLATAFMVIYMIGSPIFARLAERRSRWVLVGIGVVLWSLASGASGLALSFGMLLLTRCFVGIGEAAYGPIAPAVISDLYPVKIRGQVLAWFCLALPVGTALGYMLGEAVAESRIGSWGEGAFGMKPESWRWAFYIVVVPGILLGVRSFFMREPVRGQADLAKTVIPQATNWRAYSVLLRTPSFVLCTLGMAAMTFAMGGIAFWMPYYLEGLPNAPAKPVTMFGAILVLAGLAGTLLGGIAGDKLRARFPGSYFLVSGLTMLAGFPVFLAVLHAPFPWIWVLIFLTCFCLFFNTGPTNTILANVTHPSIRSAGFALNILVIHALGDAVSPTIIGLLNGYFGGDMSKSFFAVGLTMVLAGVLWLAGMQFLKRDTELAPMRLGH
jgi:MFS family permease